MRTRRACRRTDGSSWDVRGTPHIVLTQRANGDWLHPLGLALRGQGLLLKQCRVRAGSSVRIVSKQRVPWRLTGVCPSGRVPVVERIEVRCERSNRIASSVTSIFLLTRKRPHLQLLSARSARRVSTPSSSGCARTAVATLRPGQFDRRCYWSNTRPAPSAYANRVDLVQHQERVATR
jgi:hypothetical protein